MNQEEKRLLLTAVLIIIIAWQQSHLSVSKYRASCLIPEGKFHLDHLDDEYVRRLMRSNKYEIRLLSEYFELHTIQWRNRYKPDSEIALCVVLARLAWPERLFSLTRIFYKSSAWFSSVFNDVILFLYDHYKKIVEWHPMLDSYARLRKYSRAISQILNTENLLF